MSSTIRLRPAWMAPAMGGVIFCALGVHAAYEKRPETLYEMLYLCHVSSAVIAVGLIAHRLRPVAAGALCLGVLGIPSWLIYVTLTHDLTLTSVAAHVLPLAFAAFALRAPGIPKGSALSAIVLFALVLTASAFVSSPSENLNLAFRPGPGLEWLVVSALTWRVALVSTAFALLLCTELLVRRCKS